MNVLFSDLKSDSCFDFDKNFAKFIGSKDVVLTSHARISLWTVLNSLNLKNGDEVLMSAINLPDMVNMVLLNNLKPRIFDYSYKSYDFNIEDIKAKANLNTKVIFLTVLAGMENNFIEVVKWAKENKIIVVADLTQSMGANNNTHLASEADYSIYSLCDLKDIHSHRGGVIAFNKDGLKVNLLNSLLKIQTSPNKKYFIKFILEDLISVVLLNRLFFSFFIYPIVLLMQILNLSSSLESLTKGQGFKLGNINIGRGFWGGDGELVRKDIPSELTYQFTNFQANLGNTQLEKVHQRQKKRIENAKKLYSIIQDSSKIFYKGESHLFWKFPLWVENPDEFKKKMCLLKIDCAPSNLPVLASLEVFRGIIQDQTPHAEEMAKKIIYIPVHFYLNENEIKIIGKKILSIN
jgi:dTDP-4-amino-4,6-dideoxygalactose transaminase